MKRHHFLTLIMAVFLAMTTNAGMTYAAITGVNVTPAENTATIEWPKIQNASNYTIEILKEDTVHFSSTFVCTLVFNGEGKLLQVIYLKSAHKGNDRHLVKSAGDEVTFSHTITGLECNNVYTFSIIAENNNMVLAEFSGSFQTLKTDGFSGIKYTLNVKANNDSWGTASGGGTFPKDTIVDITATPATGYEFKQWSDGNTDNPREIILTSDTTFTALFQERETKKRTIYLNVKEWRGLSYEFYFYVFAWKNKETATAYQMTKIYDFIYKADIDESLSHLIFGVVPPDNLPPTINDAYEITEKQTLSGANNIYTLNIPQTSCNDSCIGSWSVFEDEKYAKYYEYGSCGADLSYMVGRNGQLTLTGSGEMNGYLSYDTGCAGWVPWAVWGTMIDTVILPEGLTTIGTYAFEQCAVKNITIPSTVTKIGSGALAGKLTSITCKAPTPPTIDVITDYFTQKPYHFYIHADFSIPLYVPAGSVAAYKAADYWKDFTNIQAIDGSATGYTITVKANNDAWGTVSGSGTFPKDTIVDITATPATGYEFKQWSDGNTANPRKVTVLSDSVFTAVFAEKDVVPEGKRAIYLNTGGYWWGNSFDYYIHAWKDKNNPTTIKFDYIADYLYRAYVNEEYTTAFIFYLSPNETITSIDEIWDNFMWDNRQTTIPSDKDMYVITSSYMGVWSAVEYGEWAVYDKNKSAVSFAYGSCGAKAEYAVRRDSILVITGTGEMSHYSTSTNNENPRWNWAPWEGWKGIIKDVQLKEGLTTIGAFAFELCKNITSVTIPSTVTAIGSGAFYAEKFTSITCKATTPPAFVLSSETNAVKHLFQNVDFSIPVYVPTGSVAAYKAADYWKDFTNIQAISGSTPPEVQSILTVAEAITATNALEDDATGDTEVTVEGYVVDALNFDTQYQDQIFYLADDESNSGKQYFQAYFCVAKENDTPVPVQIGDKVRLTGFLTKYMKNGSAYPEIKHGVATFVSKADKDRSTSVVDTITVARALELGATLKENEIYLRHFAIIGYITKIDNYSSLTNTHYTYFWMTDTQGSAATNATGAIYVYKGKSDVKLAVGDRVCVTGLVQNHKDTIEVEDNPTVLRINPGDANPSSKLYTIYVTVNNAKLGTVKGGGTYKSGAIVTLTATPVNGAKFEKWSDGDTYASRTVYATSNSTYTAVFKAIVSDHQAESNNQYDEKSGFIDPWENKANNAPANIQMSDDCTTSTLKVIHNGQLYIIHNGAMFNAQGVRVE